LWIDAAIAACFSSTKHIWHIRAKLGRMNILKSIFSDKTVIQIINFLSTNIIVNSEATKEPFEKFRIDKKVKLVYNGINTNFASKEQNTLRKLFNLNHDDIIVVMVGYAVKLKGGLYFVEAANFINLEIQNCYFFMMGRAEFGGEKEYYNKMVNLVKKYHLVKKFFFTGHINNVKEALLDCNLLIQPMINGSWSRVVLDAMITGVPAIGVEESGKSEMIVNGVTGAVVEKQDDLGKAAVELLKNSALLQNMSINSFKIAKNKFDIKITIKSIENIYESI